MLIKLSCKSIPEGSPALREEELAALLPQVPNWHISPDDKKLKAAFQFNNYYETMAFVNAVAWIAHQEDHHPELIVTYNQCKIAYDTHTVKGLSQNDFICAAKIDQLRPL
ncbi:MAG: 4a-hydroxytetrahydrobiopterin dehydratase [Gammaproteobacteria bacterium]|nr:4a-hydroxytetrahydrobiopterin dehydratase [Gammaproteobacteria bacterium]